MSFKTFQPNVQQRGIRAQWGKGERVVIVGGFSVLDKLPIYVDCRWDSLRKRKVFRELNALQESRFPNYDDAGGAHTQARKPPTVFKDCHVTGLK